jgi:hypothetical protein
MRNNFSQCIYFFIQMIKYERNKKEQLHAAIAPEKIILGSFTLLSSLYK